MKKNKLLLILITLLAFGQMAWAQNIVSVNYVDEQGVTQTVNATSIDHIASVNPNGSTIGSSGFTNWYVVEGSNVVMNGQLGYYGGINLILCDGAKLTVTNTDGNAIQSLDNSETTYTLTIYVQSQGTGQLVATATSSDEYNSYKAIHTENLTIHGGVVSATGGTCGIYAPSDNIVINGGTVTAEAPNGNAIEGYNITINGGIVSATGGGGIKNGMIGTTTLGYTNNTDRITATNYLLGYTAAQVKVKDGQYMITDNGVIVYGSLNENKINAIAGHTLSPYTPTEWEGLGTAQSPYIIDSEDDLNLLSLRTNGGGNDYSDTYFKLGANITFSASSDWNDATSTESNFTAIGSFSGHFDGDVYTISGLRIRKDDGVGLFSYLAEGAVVENITLNNSRVTGNSEIGGIVGRLQSGATVNNCHVTNTVYVYSKYHYTGVRGGVVGYNDGGTISNCVSEATIDRTTEVWENANDKAGGIVGVNDSGTLTGNLVIGANITCQTENYGAIAGNNANGTLTNNYYHACTVNGTANTVNIGVNGADITTSDGAMSIHTITKPNDVTITTEPTLVYGGTNFWKYGMTITLSGGLDGTPTEGWQKAYCVNGVALQENSTTIKNNFDMPAADANITIGEIHADWAISNAGSQADPYMIYFPDQLDLLATRVNAGNNYSGEYFQLMDDLTYDNTEQNNYIAIGTGSNPFSGHFDGNQKTIEGIRIYTNNGYQGVFGYIVDAELKDLNVNDIMISGHDRIGCLVGECDGSSTITNCRVTTATLIATGVSSSQQLFGGIAGRNSGTSTMSNNFVLGINIPQIYHFGAIAGENGGSLVSNYYHNYIMNGTAYPTGMGCNGGDVTANDGARPVFTVSVPEGVTVTATATVTHNEANYYKEGVTVTLSGGLDGSNPNPGCQNAYVVYGNTLIGSNLAPGHEFDMQNANAVVTIGSMPADWAVANEGTQADPYKIYFTDQLDLLATRVNAGESYSGKYFKLMDDLTYDNTQQNNYIAIGTSTHPFSGHFNGNQKTINGVRINSTGGYLGVFGYINNAEVKDLYVNDIEITAHDRVGSIVGECDGSTAISGCRVTTATLNVAGDATYQQLFGGIAGHKSGSTSTMSNNFVLGLTIPQVYHFGAIAGENSTGAQSMVSNHYHNCTVGSTAYPTGVGCNGQDVEGAKPVFTLTLADGISTDVSPVVTYNTVDYCVAGVTINLSYVTPANPGYRHIYSVNDTPIANYGTSFDISTNSEVTVAPNILINWETEYAGTEADPYLISNVEQWDILASNVSISGITYSGKFFKLMEDISITTMVGTNSKKFSGTFDGNEHTIIFDKNSDEQYIAPFRYINGATIQNLKVTGTVTSSNKFAGGIVAHATGSNTITNCVNSTVIIASISGNGSHGGILGQLGGTGGVTISGCVFNGKMRGANTDYWCGIIGYFGSNSVTISNCFFNPEEIDVKMVDPSNNNSNTENYTICRPGPNVSNCYYNEEATKMLKKQGKQARCITGGENVTVEFAGDVTEYNVCEITTNGTGIKYSDVLYAGDGDNVNLTLGAALGYSITGDFSVNAGTLTSQGNYYTLSMPDQNVTISATTTHIGKHFVTAGSWNTPGNWANNECPTSTSDSVFVHAAATIPGTYCAQAGHITIASEGSITIENGGQLIHSNAGVVATVKKNIAGHGDGLSGGWNFIASPISTPVNPSTIGLITDSYGSDVTETQPASYDLYYYDEPNVFWRNYRNVPFTLNNGQGYLYANNAGTLISFEGTLNASTADPTIAVTASGNKLTGFNLVGNPFARKLSIGSLAIEANDSYSPITAIYEISNGAVIINTDPTDIPPCGGFFIKATATGTLHFNHTWPEGSSGNSKGDLRIEVSQAVATREGTTLLDRAYINFDEGNAIDKFMLNPDATKLYIPQNGKDFAIVVSEGHGEMPLNFRANEDGNYTISVNPEGVEMTYLHLIDNMTGADVDLLAAKVPEPVEGPTLNDGVSTSSTTSYTFTAKTTDYESRFKLVFSANNEDGPSTGSEAFAFMSNGNWIIANEGEATLQVIDLNGRILSSESINGSVSKSINAVPGVYMIRLINGENVKVQKIVVR